jgi:uncharacterized membrane protein YhaH (DUF805 family)
VAIATDRVVRSRWTAERRFYTGIAIAMFVAVFVGFSRSFFLRPLFPDWLSPSEPIFYVHGALFTMWSVLLIVQPALICSGRMQLHRQLGIAGALLAVAMVCTGVLGSLVAANRATGFFDVAVPALQFLAIPLFDIVLFGSFVALAIARRHDPQAHKRWMVLASVNLMGAAVARWPIVMQIGSPFVYFALYDLFVVALVAWDLGSRGRLHPVTLWGGLLLVASQPLRLAIMGTPAWLAFAGWATSL